MADLPEKVEQQLYGLHLYGCGCGAGNKSQCLTMQETLRAAIREALEEARITQAKRTLEFVMSQPCPEWVGSTMLNWLNREIVPRPANRQANR